MKEELYKQVITKLEELPQNSFSLQINGVIKLINKVIDSKLLERKSTHSINNELTPFYTYIDLLKELINPNLKKETKDDLLDIFSNVYYQVLSTLNAYLDRINVNWKELYGNYKRYMLRTVNYSIPYPIFKNWCDKIDYYQLDDSYIFGVKENGVFIPSHIAPKSLKKGFDLLRYISTKKIALFVLENQVNLVEKLGYIKTDIVVPGKLGDISINKYLLVSNKSIIDLLDKDTLVSNNDFSKYFEKYNV